MKRMLEFCVDGWLAQESDDPSVRATLAALSIRAGENAVPITEIDDLAAQTVKPHIVVPACLVAEWLLVNWWRLRWEPRCMSPTLDWRMSHSMAGIGGGFAWPDITFSSDGEFIQIVLRAEDKADVSATRYLRDVDLDIPAAAFENAVDEFVAMVENRLVEREPTQRVVSEIRAELADERANPEMAESFTLMALAGLDPDLSAREWLGTARALCDRVGGHAGREVVAVLPSLEGELRRASDAVEQVRKAGVTVDLSCAARYREKTDATSAPWVQGAKAASGLRKALGLGTVPVSDDVLGAILGIGFPLDAVDVPRCLWGAYRNGNGSARLSVGTKWKANQRFAVARVLASAVRAEPDQCLLPVTTSYTALQKYQRSFAQEFLCPWAELHPFVVEHGTDDDAITEAAEMFGVSERLVETTLANKGLLPREILAGC